jgi:HSP20 family molecular chaperone IbpA
VEIERGQFRRVVELGADVRGQEAKAVYEDGMLRVELPLVQAPGARTVPVTKLENGS